MAGVPTGITIDLGQLGAVGDDSTQSKQPVTQPRPQPPETDGWATFNIDGYLVERVVAYHRRYRFACALETGTFRGETTVGLAKLFPRVFTIEANAETYQKTRPRFDGYKNITALLGNSAELFGELLPSLEYPLFAFLDAHWNEYCPLRDELSQLLAVKKPKLIMIHDFQVPGRKFGYDCYEGRANNLEYLGDLLPHDECRYAFNDRTAAQSADRGVLFIEHLLDDDRRSTGHAPSST